MLIFSWDHAQIQLEDLLTMVSGSDLASVVVVQLVRRKPDWWDECGHSFLEIRRNELGLLRIDLNQSWLGGTLQCARVLRLVLVVVLMD